MLQNLWDNRIAVVSVLLFAVGFSTLILHRNLMKKIIGLNIMDTAACLFLTALGHIDGRIPPIISDGHTDPARYSNPLPAGLVLTGIVVSVSVTALMLALTVRLYNRYHTLDVDHIYMVARGEQEDER
jgi:multicomponent Na+:H+ antiporter subunit C